jgi:hypothetical protein
MKKVLIALLLVGFAMSSMGEMDNIVFDPGDTTTAQSKAVSYVIRGELEQIKIVTGITAQTGTVTVACGGQTIFTGTKLTGTNWYQPRVAVHGSTGTALTFTTSATSGAAVANAWYSKIPLAGKVTVTYLNDTLGTLTNTLNEVELIYSK